ncbi:hypothetical protein NEOLEDRAFT_1139086 [Neolentinus lepideus HHB14362 ss-1]|uniref:Uncharacterized protein n=1 Tax=Neolentinus lepideus HHB14362 ss-1 TaxID=1314782 RepID=A0A165PYR7_9AGAM|nr:hypothetical protein NEOLEDRAFT_1139086 [Neolentinus lepideus HHB14362 ss-1]
MEQYFTVTRLLGTAGLTSSVLDTFDVPGLSQLLRSVAPLLRRLFSVLFGCMLSPQLPAPAPVLLLDAAPDEMEKKTSMFLVGTTVLGLAVSTIGFIIVAVWLFATRTPALDNSDSTPGADWVVNSIAPSHTITDSTCPTFSPVLFEIDSDNVSQGTVHDSSTSVGNILSGLNAPLKFPASRRKPDQRLLGGEALSQLFEDISAAASREPHTSADRSGITAHLPPLSSNCIVGDVNVTVTCAIDFHSAVSKSSSLANAIHHSISVSGSLPVNGQDEILGNVSYASVRAFNGSYISGNGQPYVDYIPAISAPPRALGEPSLSSSLSDITNHSRARASEPSQDNGRRPPHLICAGLPIYLSQEEVHEFAGGLLRASTSKHLPSIPSLDYANLSVGDIQEHPAGPGGIMPGSAASSPSILQGHRRSPQGVRGPGQTHGLWSSHVYDQVSNRRSLRTSSRSKCSSISASTSQRDQLSSPPTYGHRRSPRGVRGSGQTATCTVPTGSDGCATSFSAQTNSDRRSDEKEYILRRLDELYRRTGDHLEESKRKIREWKEARKKKLEEERIENRDIEEKEGEDRMTTTQPRLDLDSATQVDSQPPVLPTPPSTWDLSILPEPPVALPPPPTPEPDDSICSL